MIKFLFVFLILAVFDSSRIWATEPSFSRVMIVVFENANYTVALKQPFFAKLANEGALFTQFSAEAHPSQPNYLAMISGSTQGVRNDDSVSINAEHIGGLLAKKNLSWKVYAEDLPQPCFLGSDRGLYARKHIPFLSFTNVQNNRNECLKVVPSTQLKIDIASNSVPAFSMYIPNLKNDGHNTSSAFASQWFLDNFGGILNDSKFMMDTLLIITFDESENIFSKNQIFTAFYGANVKPGSVVNLPHNHYSILKMIEDHFGIGNLGNGDVTATPITGIWQ